MGFNDPEAINMLLLRSTDQCIEYVITVVTVYMNLVKTGSRALAKLCASALEEG